ncbi:MAG: ankyrin repeat domain-containing protein, partial [Cyanobacteria bacterium]|nr:ankyrin repeat domain-containing protein [Cyanobacteriota bacterium]
MNQLFNLSSFRPFHSVSKHPGKSTPMPFPLGISSPGLSPVLFQGNEEKDVPEPSVGDFFTGNTSTSVSPQSLFQAIASENLTDLRNYRYLPSQQPDLRYQFDSQGKTLAHLALESDKPELIAAFLETGFPLYTFDFNGKLPGDAWWDKNEGEKRLNAFSEGVNLARKKAEKSPQGAEAFEENLKHQLDLLLNRVDVTQKNHLQKAMELLKPTITYVPDPDCDREDKAIATPCTPENRMKALARIQCLLNLGACPNVDGLHRESPVLSAAKNNDMELLKRFLSHGASVNVIRVFLESYSNKIGDKYITHEYWTPETPLHWAVKQNNPEMIEALLQAEAPMVVSEGGVVHPMSFALQGKDDPQMLDKFMQAGASIESIIDKSEGKGITPLGMALINNQSKCVDYLLAHGASPNGPVGKDKTYLHLAVERKDYETVDKLLNAGADPNLYPPANVYGNTTGGAPLMQAVRNGDLKMVKRLIEAGASPNLVDPGNYNSSRQLPLVEAIETHRSIEMIETLLASGANPNLLDPKGSTLNGGVADSGK